MSGNQKEFSDFNKFTKPATHAWYLFQTVRKNIL